MSAVTTSTGTDAAAWTRTGRVVARRWAAGLGIALGLMSGAGAGAELGAALALAAFGYLVVALARRPGVTWPAVVVMGGAVVALRALGVAPVPVLAAAGAGLAVVALATGALGPEPLRLLQAPAAWLFGGVAVVALAVSAELGAGLVAAGLIAHAGWDVALWRARRPVVARSFVEWCAAFDLTAAAGILATLLF